MIDGEAILLIMQTKEDCFAAMPYCREQDLRQNFDRLLGYFNGVLRRPLKI